MVTKRAAVVLGATWSRRAAQHEPTRPRHAADLLIHGTCTLPVRRSHSRTHASSPLQSPLSSSLALARVVSTAGAALSCLLQTPRATFSSASLSTNAQNLISSSPSPLPSLGVVVTRTHRQFPSRLHSSSSPSSSSLSPPPSRTSSSSPSARAQLWRQTPPHTSLLLRRATSPLLLLTAIAVVAALAAAALSSPRWTYISTRARSCATTASSSAHARTYARLVPAAFTLPTTSFSMPPVCCGGKWWPWWWCAA